MSKKVLNTKYGIAKINKGYYKISSTKEGNHGKYLHQLIFEEEHNCSLLKNGVIYHINGNKLDNNISNLKLISPSEHAKLHNSKNRFLFSERTTTTGFYRVSCVKKKDTKQGYIWRYRYYDNISHTRKNIRNINLFKLKQSVISKNLEWIIIDENKAMDCILLNNNSFNLEYGLKMYA